MISQPKIQNATELKAREVFHAEDTALLRFPVLDCHILEILSTGCHEQLRSTVRGLVSDSRVREAIYLASPSLFEKIVLWEAGEGGFNDLEVTVARYLLRMAFRATPFGTFACVSACAVGASDSLSVPSPGSIRRSVDLDASVLSRLAVSLTRHQDISAQIRYEVNDTLYVVDDSIFLTAFDRNRSGKRIHKKVELENSEFLRAVIDAARRPRLLSDLAEELSNRFPNAVAKADADAFLATLVREQVLCSDSLLDVTSGDLFKHFSDQLSSAPETTGVLDRIKERLDLIRDGQDVSVEQYQRLANDVRSAGVPVGAQVAKVDLADTRDIAGEISVRVAAAVEMVVNELARLAPKKTTLATFAKRFTARFGECEVPLTQLSDDLESLGFLERDVAAPLLVRAVRPSGRRRATSPGAVRLADKVAALALGKPGNSYIGIDDLVPTVPSGQQQPVPDCKLLVWASLWQGESQSPVVEVRSIGAQDPGRIMGRFAHALPRVREFLRSSAQASRLPVAEIVHLPEDRLGNITTRPVLSTYEIRLRSGSSGAAIALPLDDLMVSVNDGRVAIRSKQLDQFLEIRMSNAHAFDRAESLPIYRFLNHVSGQGLACEPLTLRHALPQAPFLPGMKFRDVIISRPTWVFDAGFLDKLRDASRALRREMIAQWRAKWSVPSWVSLSQGDNVIPYCLDSVWMVDDFVRNALKGHSTVSDVFPEGMRPHVASESGPHFHELVLPVTRDSHLPQRRPVPSTPAESVVPIWGRWLYYVLHVPAHLQDEVLRELRPVVQQLLLRGLFKSFFFVRYRDDDGAHLRIRFEKGDPAGTASASAALDVVFARIAKRGLIKSGSLQPYVREVSRYGGVERSVICERIFHIDSIATLGILDHASSGAESWRLHAVAIDSMLMALGMADMEQRLRFAKIAAAEFDAEMQFSSSERKNIGTVLKSGPALFSEPGKPWVPIAGEEELRRSTAAISPLWQEFLAIRPALPEAELYRIQWSLVHMRMNRLLTQQHRLQEAIIWELLKRSYAGALARRKVSPPQELASGTDDVSHAEALSA